MIFRRSSPSNPPLLDPAPPPDQRRAFRRVQAPVFFSAPRLRALNRQVLDISLGGMKVYADEPFEARDHLQVELFLPEGDTASCMVRVAWQRELPPGSPAVYEVGLQIVGADRDDLERLSKVLVDDP